MSRYGQEPLINDVRRAAFKAPTSKDLESPLSYLKWLENVFRGYAKGELGWQDVRDTLKASPAIIAGFESKPQ